LKTKYFYDDQNLETFRAEYDEMPLHRKALENKPLTGGGLLATVLAVVGMLVAAGVV
jgi:restriction endonuclease Mrr